MGRGAATRARRPANGSTRSTARCLRAADARAAAVACARRRRAGVPRDAVRPHRADQERSAPAVERESRRREELGRRRPPGRARLDARRRRARARRGGARRASSRSSRRGERELERRGGGVPRAPRRSAAEIEDVRRRMGEEAAGRRAEIEALRALVVVSERERERLDDGARGRRARGSPRPTSERDGARGRDRDASTTSRRRMSEKRAQLEPERRGAGRRRSRSSRTSERRHESRRDLLEARRRDIEETAGLAVPRGRTRGARSACSRIWCASRPGLERALVAALGPLADAVVYDDGDRALADAPAGRRRDPRDRGGRSGRRSGCRASARCCRVVDADPAARGIVSTVLRDVYLAGDRRRGGRRSRARTRPHRSSRPKACWSVPR